MYKRINAVKTNHPGRILVRKMLDNFEVKYQSLAYPCMIHRPLGLSLRHLRRELPNDKLPEDALKSFLKQILIALDYLHGEAGIIHCGKPPYARTGGLDKRTDLQETNILLGIEDMAILEQFQERELSDPVPRKVDGDRITYQSRTLNNIELLGRPILTDFGEARSNESTNAGLIQPLQYRAPEVLFKMPWNQKVDIWNVGVMVSFAWLRHI